jgi:hypothetical protein
MYNEAWSLDIWLWITGNAGVPPNAAQFWILAGSGLAKSNSRSDFADVLQLC